MDDQADLTAAGYPPQGNRQEQHALIRTIGNRFRVAREMNNLSQSAAAKRLGYANSSKLSKIEKASDSFSVPLWLIIRAAKVYDVSIDFLFGVTEDWEIGARMTQEREVGAWMFDHWQKERCRDVATLRRLHDRMDMFRHVIGSMCAASEEIASAFERFMQLNNDFEEMRGGSRLQVAITRGQDASVSAKAKLARFRLECVAAAADSSQLSLSL